MEYINASIEHLDLAEHIVHKSIRTSYAPCYPPEVVEFFCHVIHTRENIRRDILTQSLWLIRDQGVFVGTGCVNGGELNRLYILPEYQGKGYGSAMMDFLEEKAAQISPTAQLSPSLPAVEFYKRRGYALIDHTEYTLKPGVILVRDTMEKKFR